MVLFLLKYKETETNLIY